ncbi:hypothetical protein [Microbulbifer sp. TYP-18]|uniref:hypothetical protein n=1 Tax=Microbulbifer sp. TYP-18 TaxID=3230024 RepID=UPI0034C61747
MPIWLLIKLLPTSCQPNRGIQGANQVYSTRWAWPAKALGGRFKDGFAGGLLGAAARHVMGGFKQEPAEQEGGQDQAGEDGAQKDGFLDKLKRAGDIDKIGELQERAFDTDQPHEAGYNAYAHEEAAYQYGKYVGSPGLVGTLRTLGEIGQFFQYTGKNFLHALGVSVTGDRYSTFSVNYFKDSYYDIAITVDGARNVPFSDAVSRHSCGCNNPIGN